MPNNPGVAHIIRSTVNKDTRVAPKIDDLRADPSDAPSVNEGSMLVGLISDPKVSSAITTLIRAVHESKTPTPAFLGWIVKVLEYKG